MRLLIALVAILFFSPQQAHAEEDPNYLYSLSFQGGMTMTRYAKPEFVEIMRAARPDGVSMKEMPGMRRILADSMSISLAMLEKSRPDSFILSLISSRTSSGIRRLTG